MVLHAKVQVTTVVALSAEVLLEEVHTVQVVIVDVDDQVLEHLALEVLKQVDGLDIEPDVITIALLVGTANNNSEPRNAKFLVINEFIAEKHKLEGSRIVFNLENAKLVALLAHTGLEVNNKSTHGQLLFQLIGAVLDFGKWCVTSIFDLNVVWVKWVGRQVHAHKVPLTVQSFKL